MAQVPQARGLSVAPQSGGGLPAQRLDAPALAFGANAAGAVLGKLGEAAGDVSADLHRHAEQMQSVDNKVLADQRAVDYSETADKIVAEYRTSNLGLAAYDNMPKVYEALENARAKGAEGLSPDAQLLYNSNSRSQLGRAQSLTRDFALTQRKASVVNTSGAKIKIEQASAASDPTYTPTAVQNIAAEWAWRTRPDTMGLSDEEAKAGMMADVGAIYAGQISVAVDSGDYPAAQELFDSHRDEMTAQQIDAVSGAMKVGRNGFIANTEANAWIAGEGVPQLPGQPDQEPLPTKVDEAVARTTVEELFPGVRVTSGKRSPADNARVGGAAKSYHLSAGAIDFTIPPGMSKEEVKAKLVQAGVPIKELLGPGDKGHSDHIHWAFGGGAQAPVRAAPSAVTDPDTYYVQSAKAVQDYVASKYAYNPTLQTQVASAIMAKVNLQTQVLRVQQRDTYERLATAVLQGDMQSEAQLSSAYQGAASDLSRLPPQYQRALMSDLKRNAQELTPERQDNIVTLRGERDTNPQSFAKRNLAEMDLPTTTRVQLMKEQKDVEAKLAKADAKVAQQDTVLKQALNTTGAKAALSSLGLTGDEKNAAYYNFAGALGIELDNYTAIHGKPPIAGSKDMNAIVSQVTATVGAKPGVKFLGMTFGADPGQPGFVVPETERQEILEAAARRGQVLNEYEVGRYYRRALSAK